MDILKPRSNFLNPYEKVYANNKFNRIFSDTLWDEAVKRGPQDLDAYIYEMNNSEKIGTRAELIEGYGALYLPERSMLDVFANEVFNKDDTEKSKRKIKVEENGELVDKEVEMTNYEYTKYNLKQQSNVYKKQYELALEKERRDNMNWLEKTFHSIVAVSAEMIGGAIQGVYGLLDLLEGCFYAIADRSAEGFRKAATNNIFNYDNDIGKWIREYERQYTDIRDITGEYTGWGKYAAGISNSIGLMLPSILTAGAASAGSAAGVMSQGFAKAISVTAQIGYYGGMLGMNASEKFNDPAFKNTPAGQIMLTETIKTGVQAVVELGMDKIVGAGVLDKLRMGKAAPKGGILNKLDDIAAKGGDLKMLSKGKAFGWWAAKTGLSGVKEGLEEVIQDTTDMIIASASSHIYKGEAYRSEGLGSFDFQTEADSFIMGMFTSLIMGGATHIWQSTKSKVSRAKQSHAINKDIKQKTGMNPHIKIKADYSTSQMMWYNSKIEGFMDMLNNFQHSKDLTVDQKNDIKNTTIGYMQFMSTLYNEWGETRFKKSLTRLDEIFKDSNTDYKKAAKQIREEFNSYGDDYKKYLEEEQQKAKKNAEEVEAAIKEGKLKNSIDGLGETKTDDFDDTSDVTVPDKVEPIKSPDDVEKEKNKTSTTKKKNAKVGAKTDISTPKTPAPDDVKIDYDEVKKDDNTGVMSRESIVLGDKKVQEKLEKYRASGFVGVVDGDGARGPKISEEQANIYERVHNTIKTFHTSTGTNIDEIIIVEKADSVIVQDDGVIIVPQDYFNTGTLDESISKITNDVSRQVANEIIANNDIVKAVLKKLLPILTKYNNFEQGTELSIFNPKVIYTALRFNEDAVYALMGELKSLANDSKIDILVRNIFTSMREQFIPQIKTFLLVSKTNRLANVPKGIFEENDELQYIGDLRKALLSEGDVGSKNDIKYALIEVIKGLSIDDVTKESLLKRAYEYGNRNSEHNVIDDGKLTYDLYSIVHSVIPTYNDIDLLKEKSFDDIYINSFLISKGYSVEDIVKISKTDENLFLQIKDNFTILSDGQYELIVTDDNRLKLKSIQSPIELKYNPIEYGRVRGILSHTESAESSKRYITGVLGSIAKSSDNWLNPEKAKELGYVVVNSIVDESIPESQRNTLTLTDVIMNPMLLSQSIRNDIRKFYKYVSYQTAFRYLRKYIPLVSDGKIGITITQDNKFIYTQLSSQSRILPIESFMNTINNRISKRSGLITFSLDEIGVDNKFFKNNEYLSGIQVIIDESMTFGEGQFRPTSNTIAIGFSQEGRTGKAEVDERILRHVFCHEFTHAIQTYNYLSLGSSSSLFQLLSVSDKQRLIKYIKENYSGFFELFPNIPEEVAAGNFLYLTTYGEQQAESAEMLTRESDTFYDIFPTVVRDIGNDSTQIIVGGKEVFEIEYAETSKIAELRHVRDENGNIVDSLPDTFTDGMSYFKGVEELGTYFKNVKNITEEQHDVLELFNTIVDIVDYQTGAKQVRDTYMDNYIESIISSKKRPYKTIEFARQMAKYNTIALSLYKYMYFRDMSNEEFLNMNVPFVRGSSNSIQNQGDIRLSKDNAFASVTILWNPEQFNYSYQMNGRYATNLSNGNAPGSVISEMYFGVAPVKEFLAFMANDLNEAILSKDDLAKYSKAYRGIVSEIGDSDIRGGLTSAIPSENLNDEITARKETINENKNSKVMTLSEIETKLVENGDADTISKVREDIESIKNEPKILLSSDQTHDLITTSMRNYEAPSFEEQLNSPTGVDLPQINQAQKILYNSVIDNYNESKLDNKSLSLPENRIYSSREAESTATSPFSKNVLRSDYSHAPQIVTSLGIEDTPGTIVYTVWGDPDGSRRKRPSSSFWINDKGEYFSLPSNLKPTMTYRRPIRVDEMRRENITPIDNSTNKPTKKHKETKVKREKVNRTYVNQDVIKSHPILKAYEGTYQSADFVEFVTSIDESKIDYRLLESIKNGKLTKRGLIAFARNQKYDDYTLQMLQRTLFKNKSIKSYKFLVNLVQHDAEFFAISRLVTTHPDLFDSDILEGNFSSEKYAKIKALIESNETLKAEYDVYSGRAISKYDEAMPAYDMAVYTNKKGQRVVADTTGLNQDVRKILKVLLLQYYDGSMKSVFECVWRAKALKDGAIAEGWKLTGDDKFTAPRATISVDNLVDGTDVSLIDTLSDNGKGEAALDDVIDKVDNADNEAIGELSTYLTVQWAKKQGFVLSPKSSKEEVIKFQKKQSEFTRQLREMDNEKFKSIYREYYYSTYYGTIATKAHEYSEEQEAKRAKEQPKHRVEHQEQNKRRNVLRNIDRLKRRLERLPVTDFKKLVKENSDIFNKDGSLKTELYTEHYDEATGKRFVPDVEEALKVEDRLVEINEKVGLVTITREESIQVIERLKQRLEESKLKIERLRQKKIPKTKLKIVYIPLAGGTSFSINASKDCPEVYKGILQTIFSKVSKSEFSNLDNDSDETHIKKSAEEFYAQNDKAFLSMDQEAVDNVIDYILNSSPSFNEETMGLMSRYNTISIYTLAYFLTENGKHNYRWRLTQEQDERIRNYIKVRLSTAGSVLPAFWRATNVLEGHKAAVKSMAKKYDMTLEDADIEKLEAMVAKYIQSETYDEAVAASKALKEFRTELYKKLKDQYKGRKRSFFKKFYSFQRMAMLSSPGTWIRNISSNFVLKYINKLSEKIGSLIPRYKFSNPNRFQYKLIGTKIDPENANFIQHYLTDTGMLDLIGDGLSKYDSDKIAKAFIAYRDYQMKKGTDNVTSKVKAQNLEYSERTIQDMIVSSLFAEVINKNQFDTKVLNGISKILNVVLSDERVIRKTAMEYLGKMMTEKNMKPKNLEEFGVEGIEMIAQAYTLAAYDYMHKGNIFGSFERTLREKAGEGAVLIYKQILPFASASFNWFLEAAKLTPIGLAVSIGKYLKLEKRLNLMEEKQRVGIRQDNLMFQEYLGRRDIGKGIIGTMIAIFGFALSRFGFADIDDDDDKVKIIIGNIRIDVSEMFGTSGLLLGMLLGSNKLWEKRDIWAAAAQVSEQFWLDSTFTDIFNAFRNNDTFGEYFVQLPFKILGMSTFNILKVIAGIVNSNFGKVQYEKGAVGQLQRWAVSAIPGIANEFPKQVDPYTGEIQLKYKVPMLYEFINRFLPIGVSDYNVSDYEKEAILVGSYHGALSGKYSDIGQLSPEQIQALNVFYGKLNKEALDDLMNDRIRYTVTNENDKKVQLFWSKMSDEQKKSAINSIMSKNASYSKIYVYTQVMNRKYYSTDDMYMQLRRLGITRNVYKQNNKYKGFV